MTQIPPVSPDFAAMAREIVTVYLERTFDAEHFTRHDENLADAIARKLTLSHAAGRAEGLETAAIAAQGGHSAKGDDWGASDIVIGYSEGRIDAATAVRALASDPVAGDQVAEDSLLKVDDFWGVSAPAPVDPGLAAQEVERPWIETAALNLLHELEDGEEHGGDAFDLDCPVCKAMLAVDAALSTPKGPKE